MNIREKILVIEDEKSIAHFISTILTANGYDAMRASSGAEAMSMISSHCPDLVILDLGLPDMDGLDILRQIRRERHDSEFTEGQLGVLAADQYLMLVVINGQLTHCIGSLLGPIRSVRQVWLRGSSDEAADFWK